MSVNPDQKRTLLQEQIDEANSGQPADFQLWRQKTEVVLRNVLGDGNALYRGFSDIRYSLTAFSSETPASAWERARQSGVLEAIAILEAAKLEVDLSGGAPEPRTGRRLTGRTTFIVHGHDEARKHEVARFLVALTGNEPVILHEQASEGRTIIEKFETSAANAGYAVVIATGDDIGRAADSGADQPRARQNVIFELGFFFGALGRTKVALLYEENIERPSDIDGLVHIPLDPGGGWKLLLARELDAADVGVDWTALR